MKPLTIRFAVGVPVGGIVLAAGFAVFWNCPRSPRTGPCASYPSIFGVSLEGNAEPTLAPQSKLRSQADLLLRLKKPGRDPLPLFGLISLFQRLRPYGVHTHHIGPLLYRGPAAPTAAVPAGVHKEHDAWHLQNARRRRIVRLAAARIDPVLVADASQFANTVAKPLYRPIPKVA